MWLPFSLNQYSKIILGTVFTGLCLSLQAQTVPLQTPADTSYPGIIETFEKLIQVDNSKFKKRTEILVKTGQIFTDVKSITLLELEPDFLNSIILHSDPGYLKLASTDKCRFYETILTDLLRSAEGKIKNVQMTYVEKDVRQSALINRKDFLNKVVNEECPDTKKTIADFQVKTLDQTLKKIDFDIPTGETQCRNIHLNWLNNPKTPFLCQLYEYVREANEGGGDLKDLPQRRTMAKIIESKQTLVQKDYITNLCKHLDNEDLFCEEFLNVSFWTKIAAGYEENIYAEDICQKITGTTNLSKAQYQVCLARLKKEKDLCLYPAGSNSGIRPQPDCDQLSTALNFSSLKANYKDCPGSSDQMIATNMGRLINHFSSELIHSTSGPCSSLSTGLTMNFNKNFDNNESWKLEACYDDKLNDKEICTKTFFGQFKELPESYTNVVANILKKTRGAANSTECIMVDSVEYNPLLLQYKSGCFIIFERDSCFISSCKHKILYNDRTVDFIRTKGVATISYFPTNVRDEKFSQHYLLTRDFKKKGKALNNLSSLSSYFKTSKNGIAHGVGCAEYLLPTFVKIYSINQCTPLPFIINGMIKDKDKVVFVTRTGADSVQSPRLLSWSTIYSGVKSYQRMHPLKLWTMYGLD